jgi:hypothetical protein
MSPLELFASAIATKEGWFAPIPNLPRTNNNPGDLRASPLTRPKDKYNFVVFTNPREGTAALYHDLLLKAMRGMSVAQIITAWAPPSDGNNTAQYIKEVCAWTGLKPTDLLWDSLPLQNLYTYKQGT